MDLKEEEILGKAIDRHWYYVAKGRALRDFLGDLKVPEILDVGAGSGIFSRQLLDHGLCDRAVCVDPFYDEEKAETHNGKPISFVKGTDTVSQKLILMMDVLEHVDDDLGLLRQFSDPMPDDAHIMITVPAFRFLWSGHDVFLEHRRRYTVKQVEKLVRDAGLEPVKSRYFFGALFPAVAAIRLAKRALLERGKVEAKSDLSEYPDWLNNSLVAIHDLERKSLFHFNKLAGLSVFCLCKRRAGSL